MPPALLAKVSSRNPRRSAWCTDQGCGRTDPLTPSGSGEADVARASQFQHAVGGMDGDVQLGRPTLIRMRAQPVADHLKWPPLLVPLSTLGYHAALCALCRVKSTCTAS